MDKINVEHTLKDCSETDLKNKGQNSFFGTSINKTTPCYLFKRSDILFKKSGIPDYYYANTKNGTKMGTGLIYFCNENVLPLVRQYVFSTSMSYCGNCRPYINNNLSNILKESSQLDDPSEKKEIESCGSLDELMRPQLVYVTDLPKYNCLSSNNPNILFDSMRGFREVLDLLTDRGELETITRGLNILHGLSDRDYRYSTNESELMELMFSLQGFYDVETFQHISDLTDIPLKYIKQIWIDKIHFFVDDYEKNREVEKNKVMKLEKIVADFKKI